MHGTPRVTMTHTVWLRLHSRHTLSSSAGGTTPKSSARIAASTWRPLTGQPHSSRSTLTWRAMGVEVASVRDVVRASHRPPASQPCPSRQVAQRLQAARGGAGADGDQETAVGAHTLDALEFVGRGDAAFDEGDVHLGLRIHRAGLGEMRDIHQPAERQQVFAQVQEGQLAAVAGGELVHRDARLGRSWS